MTWVKRIFLFGLVNILVLVTISLLLNLLGVRPYLTNYGIDYTQLMIFCLVWGMGGAMISLLLSRVMAKWMMGVQVIDPQAAHGDLARLVQLVHGLAQRAQLSRMPQVGIYESDEVNAFATGPTRSRALVAVSSGLLRRMNWEEMEAVLGHEISHVGNGDMVTMMLLQGVINAFVMFFARVIAFAVSQGAREDSRRAIQFGVTFILEIVLSILGFMVVAAFSRWREFRADRGGAQLAGRQKMIQALSALQRTLHLETAHAQPQEGGFATFKISNKPHGFLALMSTHPPLEERIRRLREEVI